MCRYSHGIALPCERGVSQPAAPGGGAPARQRAHASSHFLEAAVPAVNTRRCDKGIMSVLHAGATTPVSLLTTKPSHSAQKIKHCPLAPGPCVQGSTACGSVSGWSACPSVAHSPAAQHAMWAGRAAASPCSVRQARMCCSPQQARSAVMPETPVVLGTEPALACRKANAAIHTHVSLQATPRAA